MGGGRVALLPQVQSSQNKLPTFMQKMDVDETANYNIYNPPKSVAVSLRQRVSPNLIKIINLGIIDIILYDKYIILYPLMLN